MPLHVSPHASTRQFTTNEKPRIGMPQRDNFMLACPLAYHPAVARRFVEDMRAFQAAEPNAIKRAEIAARHCMG